jgi:hypothetical protein
MTQAVEIPARVVVDDDALPHRPLSAEAHVVMLRAAAVPRLFPFALFAWLASSHDANAAGASPVIAPPADLPDDVIAPTATEARGLHELWVVRDGRLWMRSDAAGSTWTLLGGTGRPDVDGAREARLIAVSADEDGRFVVVADDGAVFHYEGSWNVVWGLPFLPFTQGRVTLPFPTSSLREGKLAYSQRHKAVGWSEDARGQQFYWGSAGTTSVYLLSDDGQRIFLLDPWLPPDTTRELSGPDDGAVTMASIAASASTLFAIADDGALFTRFEDYDANGGTPFYTYAYDDFVVEGLPGTDPRSETQVHALPVAPWQRQPAIVLSGQARLSRRTAIVQTGQGNAARLLRVVGDDEHGVRGVYEKSLDAPAWTFRAVDVAVADASWLGPPAPSSSSSSSSSAPPRRHYEGIVAHGGAGGRAVFAATDDFWFQRAMFHLDVVDHAVDGGVAVPLVVHTADLWSLFRENNAVDDPLAPRMLKATITLDATRATPQAARSARALFGDKLDQVFGFVVIADGDELVLAPVDYPLSVDVQRRAWVLRASPSSRRVAPLPLARRTAAAHVDLDDVAVGRCAVDAALRARAQTALGAVQAERAELSSRASFMTTLSTTLPLVTLFADATSVVSTTRWTVRDVRWLTSFEQHLPALSQGPRLAYARRLVRSQADFEDVTARLVACVRAGR